MIIAILHYFPSNLVNVTLFKTKKKSALPFYISSNCFSNEIVSFFSTQQKNQCRRGVELIN